MVACGNRLSPTEPAGETRGADVFNKTLFYWQHPLLPKMLSLPLPRRAIIIIAMIIIQIQLISLLQQLFIGVNLSALIIFAFCCGHLQKDVR